MFTKPRRSDVDYAVRSKLSGAQRRNLKKAKSGKEILFWTNLRILNQVLQTQKVEVSKGFYLISALGSFLFFKGNDL